jgi:hypothetical protein
MVGTDVLTMRGVVFAVRAEEDIMDHAALDGFAAGDFFAVYHQEREGVKGAPAGDCHDNHIPYRRLVNSEVEGTGERLAVEQQLRFTAVRNVPLGVEMLAVVRPDRGTCLVESGFAIDYKQPWLLAPRVVPDICVVIPVGAECDFAGIPIAVVRWIRFAIEHEAPKRDGARVSYAGQTEEKNMLVV